MAHSKIIVGLGSCGIAAGAREVYDYIEEAAEGSDIEVGITSCVGMCYAEPIVEVIREGTQVRYGNVDREFAGRILEDIEHGELPEEHRVNREEDTRYEERQVKIALRNCGVIDPESIEEYLQRGGYEVMQNIITRYEPRQVIDIVKDSGLRGRGGAGFLTGKKWEFLANADGKIKYLVCNADEGDPGAFMDRAMLEGDPHAVIEGMIIAAYASGATHGYVYCRAEYPLAVSRLKKAIEEAEKRDFLGESILGSDFSFSLEVKEGAGAFVCGEETALMASIEGRRGMPRIRPPYPAQAGINEYPTNINNVETYTNVSWILRHGADEYKQYSYGNSYGTKVFALAGKIKHGGLIEVPMGITIREIVEEIGGGTVSGKPVKAVQIGGPAGGCIPERLFDTPIDYDSVNSTGAIMGSGGLIVMDEDTCMVDVAKYFLTFTQNESCGKCTFCRIGTKRMLEILERITAGQGQESDMQLLEELSRHISRTSLCGLGQLAPNPVLTTLRYFKEEYEAHIFDRSCPAGVCKPLITYVINSEKCTGCTACAKVCPVGAISGERKQVHEIDPEICTRCGMCVETCRFDAIEVR
jgi:NADH-quinone oxidoreductase subunit F